MSAFSHLSDLALVGLLRATIRECLADSRDLSLACARDRERLEKKLMAAMTPLLSARSAAREKERPRGGSRATAIVRAASAAVAGVIPFDPTLGTPRTTSRTCPHCENGWLVIAYRERRGAPAVVDRVEHSEPKCEGFKVRGVLVSDARFEPYAGTALFSVTEGPNP